MDYLLTLSIPGQPVRQATLQEGVYLIGRGADCTIALNDHGVSHHHARLELTSEEAWITDLQSSNGTFVNARAIAARVELSTASIITIGNAVFRVQPRVAAPTPEVKAAPTPVEAAPSQAIPAMQQAQAMPTLSPAERARQERHRHVKSQLHAELVKRLGLKRLATQAVSPEELEARVRSTLKAILDELQQRDAIPAEFSTQALMDEIYDEAVRLGPIEKFLADDSITEVMVNGPSNVYVERRGKLELTDQTFMDDESVMAVIERIVAPLGRRIDESQP